MTRELSDAAVRIDNFLTDDNNISKDNERETEKHSKSIATNRLQVELDRYTKIGAIDKQVVLIAYISFHDFYSSRSKPLFDNCIKSSHRSWLIWVADRADGMYETTTHLQGFGRSWVVLLLL